MIHNAFYIPPIYRANDKENDRNAYDSIVGPRALREIYLMPFMLAQKYAQPWAYMTAYDLFIIPLQPVSYLEHFTNSYNRLNGTHASENKFLLQDVLRGEWGFDGMVRLTLRYYY